MGAQVQDLVNAKLQALEAAGDPSAGKAPKRLIVGPHAFGFHGPIQAAIEAADPQHVCALYW